MVIPRPRLPGTDAVCSVAVIKRPDHRNVYQVNPVGDAQHEVVVDHAAQGDIETADLLHQCRAHHQDVDVNVVGNAKLCWGDLARAVARASLVITINVAYAAPSPRAVITPTMASRKAGCHSLSESRNAMNPPRASAMPALRAAEAPSCWRAISRMRGSSSAS